MISEQSFCIYCQREYGTPKKLANHIKRKHQGTWAHSYLVQEELAKEKESK